MIENNRIFEEQELSALGKMKKIGMELNETMGFASQELSSKKREVMELLKDLQERIQKCSEKEHEAFKVLEKVMKERKIS
jgi:hypothetical protein